jgi:hypothetical protein
MWSSTDPLDRIMQLMPQVREIQAADMAQLHPFELLPEALARVQLRRIGGEPLQVEALGCPIGQERLNDLTTVNGGTVPDDDHPAWDFTQQVLQEGDHICRVESAILTMEIPFALR